MAEIYKRGDWTNYSVIDFSISNASSPTTPDPAYGVAAAFFYGKWLLGKAKNHCCKDHSSTEESAPEEEGSGGSGSKASHPISPLDLGFEKVTGVTVGLGVVPYLASLWLDDPYEKHIVFGINMGVDHYSRSVVEGAKTHAFEANYCSDPFPAKISSPSSPSLLSPTSHIPQIGCEEKYSLGWFDTSKENYSAEDLDLSSDNIYGSFDERSSRLEEREEYQVARGANNSPVITAHVHNCKVIDQPRERRAVGGLSALFGCRTNIRQRDDDREYCQFPIDEELVVHCHFCKKLLLDKEGNNDIITIFKGSEYPHCSKQCWKVEVGGENDI